MKPWTPQWAKVTPCKGKKPSSETHTNRYFALKADTAKSLGVDISIIGSDLKKHLNPGLFYDVTYAEKRVKITQEI